MHKGWVLCKLKFQESYETIRLIEEFKNIIQGKSVFIIGAGPSLTRSLKYIKKSNR